MISNNPSGLLVVTDLDGTLLDHQTYSWSAALRTVQRLNERRIPIIINTSKTANEVISLQWDMGLKTPFIVENGSAVYWPEKYAQVFDGGDVLSPGFRGKILGQTRSYIVTELNRIRKQFNWRFEGFSDWSIEQIMGHTGLSPTAARMSQARGYSEPILWKDSPQELGAFTQVINELGLNLLKGGRFYHVLGGCNKGDAMLWLSGKLEKMWGMSPTIIALGDSGNDADMLELADWPVLVKSPKHNFPVIDKDSEEIYFTKGYGPEGWREAVEYYLQLVDGALVE